jgi:hypothetical protein
MSAPSATPPRSARAAGPRLYRLVDQHGEPHPILDDLYDSLEAAWSEAIQWWKEQVGAEHTVIGIGVEVSTASGDWRTLRHPGS